MVDFSELKRFSKPGPRYTSYPTALEFSPTFDWRAYVRELGAFTHLPFSIYTHLPFCKSACYFCGCNVIYTSKEEKKLEYILYLKKEIDLLKNYIDTKREVLQFHFGGGTPSFYNAKQLEEIILLIKSVFSNFSPNAEISCEIDPRFFDEAQMQVLKNHGFNRLSFGIQDFNSEVQQAVHRIQSIKTVENAVNLARKYGIECINFDLIYGLPKQNLASFQATLKQVLEFKPSRLAIFNYAHVPWIKKTMRKIDERDIPPPDEKLKILESTIDFLTKNNYKSIGMDHFALENDELYQAYLRGELKRNFQGYTAKKHTQTLGLGLTSIGEGHNYYVQNFKDYDAYKNALDSNKLPIERGIKLTNEDILRKNIIMKLMNNFFVDIKRIESKFNIDFKSHFRENLAQLDEFIELGFVKVDENFIKISPKGALLVRNIVMVFDEHLQIQDKRFSKTV